MHARELVDLAAVLASHSAVLIRRSDPLPAMGMEEYWAAAKSRLDRWGCSLRRFAVESQAHGPQWYRQHGPAVCAVLEEIVTGEMLTRVWTSLVCAHDRRHGLDDAEPVARSVFLGHIEMRHRVQTLLVQQPIDVREAFRLDHLRRRCDRWSDMLVGYLTRSFDTREFAADAARALDFSADLQGDDTLPNGARAWTIIRASLHATFRRGLAPSSPNADLNARIAGGILGCFPSELFDSTGLLRSVWSLRLSEVASDAQGMVEHLLSMDRGNPAALPGFLTNRYRRFT